MSVRGLLIAVEGPDGFGRGALCATLANMLRSRGGEARVRSLPDLDAPATGAAVRDARTGALEVDADTLALLEAANLRENMPGVLGDVRRGAHVICDRYVWSNVERAVAAGTCPTFATSLNAGAPVPDVTVYLREASSKHAADVRARRFFDHVAAMRPQWIEVAAGNVDYGLVMAAVMAKATNPGPGNGLL